MKPLLVMTREEFVEAMNAGRLFAWAGLYERQDYVVDLGVGGGGRRVLREITNEPELHTRAIGRKK